nr:MAG TPA: hypothetical protein [Caudoviricetes sp.]
MTQTSPVWAVSLSMSALLVAVNVSVMASAGSTAVSNFPSLPSTGILPEAVPVFLVAAVPRPLILPALIPPGISDALSWATPVTMPLVLTVTFVYVPAVKACPARAVVMARLAEPLKLPEPVTSPDRLMVREDDNQSALATLFTEAVPVALSTVTLPVPLADLMPPRVSLVAVGRTYTTTSAPLIVKAPLVLLLPIAAPDQGSADHRLVPSPILIRPESVSTPGSPTARIRVDAAHWVAEPVRSCKITFLRVCVAIMLPLHLSH